MRWGGEGRGGEGGGVCVWSCYYIYIDIYGFMCLCSCMSVLCVLCISLCAPLCFSLHTGTQSKAHTHTQDTPSAFDPYVHFHSYHLCPFGPYVHFHHYFQSIAHKGFDGTKPGQEAKMRGYSLVGKNTASCCGDMQFPGFDSGWSLGGSICRLDM